MARPRNLRAADQRIVDAFAALRSDPDAMMRDGFFTVDQACAELHVTSSTLYTYFKPPISFPRTAPGTRPVLIPRAAVQAYMRARMGLVTPPARKQRRR